MTAFEPFGGRKTNTSADLLREFRKNPGSGAKLPYSYAILPVNFRTAWPKLNSAIRRHRPSAVLLMGEKRTQRITVETTGRNRRIARRGLKPIRQATPGKIRSEISISRLAGVDVSHNAGAYLCNFVYYKALSHQKSTPTIFVHVPALDHDEWQACQKSFITTLQNVMVQITKAIDGTTRNGSKRENKKGAYHG